MRYQPAFPTQQHEDPPETAADPSGGNLFDPSKQWRVIVLPGLVVPRRAILTDDLAGAAHADAVTIDQMAHGRLALRGHQSFFESTSCSAIRSSVNFDFFMVTGLLGD